MTIQYKPILSVGDQAALGMRPESYLGNIRLPNGGLQGELEFRFINFSIFHQSIYREINERLVNLDNYVKKHEELLRENFVEEMDLLIQSRCRTRVHEEEDVILSIKSLADETAVVGLWAIIEQFMSRNYIQLAAAYEGIAESEVRTSFRWDVLKHKYFEYGINFEEVECYNIANECRVLNNKIKHLNYVDEELSRFSSFTESHGKRFKYVDLKLQKYADGCYKYIGSLIEKTGHRIEGLLTNA